MDAASGSGPVEPPGPGGLPPGYDGVAVSKALLRATRAGALATLALEGGYPFATLVNVATDVDGGPILLTSALSAHTRNLAADPRASILLAAGGKGDPLAHPRLTVVGRMTLIGEAGARARLRRRFLARHPKSALYADFGDFGFWRMAIDSAHLNGGFAKAADFAGDVILTRLDDAEELIAIEEDALAHMNNDHAESVRLYATHFAGEKDGAWRATGLDPEGIDLALGDLTARVAFPRPARTAAELRAVLAEMAATARAGTR
jgi:putative heme iron utilization protein